MMETSAVDSLALGGSVITDMSIWGLFLHADWVVKVVMMLLLGASVLVWAVVFNKWSRLRKLSGQAERFEESFWSGGSLEELYDRIGAQPSDPMSAMFAAAMSEWRRTAGRPKAGNELHAGLTQRIERAMQITLGREMVHIERHMAFLASVGSTAPFIGLFGTVWGIMNSFSSIAMTKNTSLAVVAPGISEALFATALGLVAAIPAVVAYNKLSTDMGRYAGRLEAFAGEFNSILSRQVEEAA